MNIFTLHDYSQLLKYKLSNKNNFNKITIPAQQITKISNISSTICHAILPTNPKFFIYLPSKYISSYIIKSPQMDNPEPNIDDLIIALPLNQKVPVVALKNLLQRRTALDQEQEEELEKVRKRYDELVKPLLERASQLIQGKEPKQEEIAEISQYLRAGEKVGQLKGKVIDRYWNAALQNSQVAGFITEKDEKAMEYLLDVQVVDAEKDETNTSINLRFIFKPNSYFTETSVIRRLKYAEGGPVALEGDLLTWKTGNWLTHESKKVSNKATGESKMVQGKKIESFFDIFLNWTAADNPEQLQKSEAIFNELMVVIRDSLSYFLGLFDVDDGSEQEQELQEQQQQEEEAPKNKKKK